jgi:hypothetical protein
MVYYYSTLFDPFELIFHKFNRPFQEVKGIHFEVSEDESKGFAYINAIGVKTDDIDITFKNGERNGTVEFTVKGETKVDNLKPFNVDVSFLVSRPVKTLHKRFENGIVILEIGFDKPSQPDIEIV